MDKTPARNTKRNAGGEAPASKAPVAPATGSARRGGYQGGNEGGKCASTWHQLGSIFFYLDRVLIRLSDSFP